jgi:hypothetical protein
MHATSTFATTLLTSFLQPTHRALEAIETAYWGKIPSVEEIKGIKICLDTLEGSSRTAIFMGLGGLAVSVQMLQTPLVGILGVITCVASTALVLTAGELLRVAHNLQPYGASSFSDRARNLAEGLTTSTAFKVKILEKACQGTTLIKMALELESSLAHGQQR